MDREELMSNYKYSEGLIQGKWAYQKSSTDFNDVLDTMRKGEKLKWLPKILFFGKENYGFDLNDMFYYDGRCFSIETSGHLSHNFCFFVVNHFSTLVLYEMPKDENACEDVVFHIYDRRLGGPYLLSDIKKLKEKFSSPNKLEHISLNAAYFGKYEMYDQILESEIEDYAGQVKTQDACYLLDPLFNILDIKENCDVYVMSNDDEISLKASDGTIKNFDRENSKMKISPCVTFGIDFYIENFNGKKHWGKYRKIGDEEFLFVDLDCDPDIDEEIYVFKKVN